MESLYDNGSKIIGWTPATKVAGIAATHSTHTIVAEAFGEKMTLSRTLEYPGGKILPYVFVALAWSDTIISVFSEDPVTRANERGYVLK